MYSPEGGGLHLFMLIFPSPKTPAPAVHFNGFRMSGFFYVNHEPFLCKTGFISKPFLGV